MVDSSAGNQQTHLELSFLLSGVKWSCSRAVFCSISFLYTFYSFWLCILHLKDTSASAQAKESELLSFQSIKRTHRDLFSNRIFGLWAVTEFLSECFCLSRSDVSSDTVSNLIANRSFQLIQYNTNLFCFDWKTSFSTTIGFLNYGNIFVHYRDQPPKCKVARVSPAASGLLKVIFALQ